VTLLIDTAVVPAHERLDFWLESSCHAYHPLQVRTPSKDAFWAQMWGYDVGPIGVFRIAAAANTMIRTSHEIRASDPECLHFSVILRGALNAAQDRRTTLVRVGDVFSYETSRPTILRTDEPFEALVVSVPRHLLGRDAPRISSRTAVGICQPDGHATAAASFVRRLARRLEDGSFAPADRSTTAEHVLDLIRGLYAGPDWPHERARPASRAEILLSVESCIESNLGDPDLAPEDIAKASFISTRYLHKLFESEGTSVCEWIRKTRLERCAGDLLDATLRHQTILAIASRWGLPGAQHFSRVFRVEYGCSPREFRRQSRRGG
jgi:AraC-like DNA-binding protein